MNNTTNTANHPTQEGWCYGCNPDNCSGCATPAAPAQVGEPLTDSQIADIYFEALGSQHLREQDRKMVTRFARAIEAAHGITAAQKGGKHGTE